ncbi:hypothetical protein PMZ80_002894 [Knufia obscura]|uniref:Uncharacterized protein n=1 Tax=Knufia obscura TaxID=1635080 RepID=A0ABR0RYK7_9EURO|nr:hypothetical protein PMZ80_002894 [Knufia obscura]
MSPQPRPSIPYFSYIHRRAPHLKLVGSASERAERLIRRYEAEAARAGNDKDKDKVKTGYVRGLRGEYQYQYSGGDVVSLEDKGDWDEYEDGAEDEMDEEGEGQDGECAGCENSPIRTQADTETDVNCESESDETPLTLHQYKALVENLERALERTSDELNEAVARNTELEDALRLERRMDDGLLRENRCFEEENVRVRDELRWYKLWFEIDVEGVYEEWRNGR